MAVVSHLVDLPSAPPGRDHRTGLVPAEPDRLMADFGAMLWQQVFDIALSVEAFAQDN